MAKHDSRGWHFQSVRHSNARKTGRAGGVYASERIKTILRKHPEYKNLSFKELKGKGIFLKYQSDSDKDGVKNIKDCKPLNQKEQDLKETATKVGGWVKKEAKAVGSWAKKESEAIKTKVKEEYVKHQEKRRDAIRRAVEQATQQKVLDEQSEEEKEAMISRLENQPNMVSEMNEAGMPTNYSDMNINKLFTTSLSPEEAQRTAERTTRALTKAEHKKIDDLADVDVKELSDEELKTITIRLGTGFFGQGRRFEEEIKRRIRERERVETDLRIELEKAQLESKKRLDTLREDLNKTEKGGYIWDDLFGTKQKK
jgi:hypothetical protein